MPRTEDVLTIFLASPSDVADERAKFADVIADWNRAWSRDLGLRLELVRWEDDAYPAIGLDAQDVINQQMPTDYDLFVGVMWARLGTPTGRAGSGTEEEFERALACHLEAPDAVDILFYFKDAPISPSKLDPAQLAKVQEFKASLQARGLLLWEFSGVEQFEKLVHLHLTRHVQAWRKRREDVLLTVPPASAPLAPASVVPRKSTSGGNDDDAGYIDLLEEFIERSAEMSDIALRLASAQNELTEHIQKGSSELGMLKEAGGELSPSEVRRTIARVADELLRFTNRVEVEIPLFRTAVDRSMAVLVKAATVVAEVRPDQVIGTKDAASALLATLADARRSTRQFQETTAALPRMTKELNVAKRKQVAALESLITEFENTERLLVEAIAVIDALPPPP
jgi:hypothetical protein